MMNILLVVLSLVFTAAFDYDAREDFMRAMDEVSSEKTLKVLQNRLLEHAVPRRSLSEAAYEEDSFDLTQYAMKYVGCQNIKSFSDDLAENQYSDTVLGYNRFVVFRLCKSSKCSSYNRYGCQDSFGEYIIEMEMYLEIMSDYHQQKFIEYCSACIDCMNPPTDDTLYSVYNSTTNVTTSTWTAAGDCEYYNACRNYNQACKNYDANIDMNNYTEILGCTAFAIGNDVAYLGPHCGSDGKSITMGLFKDNECTKYVGNEADSGYSTGVDDSLLQFFYSPTCVSCMNANTYALYSDDTAANGLYGMCEVLYEASAKCNRYLDVESTGSTYNSSVQENDETRVCNFVESLMENNYDETGEIILKSESFHAAEWRSYQNVVNTVSPVQQFGLASSFLLMLGLFFYSIHLYRKVRWMKTAAKLYPTYRADDVIRSQSGICVNRTTTDFSTFA